MDVRSPAAMQPTVFAILAGLTPPDVELTLFDERLEPIPEDHKTDLVALSVCTYSARRAYQIATGFRKRGIQVVMGGFHPSFLPEEALVYADAVVVGDAEGNWEQLVADARQGSLQRVYERSTQPSLKGLRFDRSIFNGKRYIGVVPVQFGRGCQYACEFCSIHALYGSRIRQRPVEDVVAEIEALDRRYILFVDDNLCADRPKVEELLRALIPLNVRWTCQVSVDIAGNPDLLDLMSESGCFCAMIGLESLDVGNLRQMRKTWNLKARDYDSAIREFRQRGIMVWSSFVFGYDHDTPDTFQATVDFAVRSKCLLANMSTLAPMPGTKLFERMLEDGRMLYERWWLHPDYRYGQATFRPLQMTADELTKGCMRARRVFHGYRSIFTRALDPASNSRSLRNLGIFLGANLVARRELSTKLARPLGAATPLQPRLEDVPIPAATGRGQRPATVSRGAR